MKCEALTELSLPCSVTEIEHSAFSMCINLKKIYIPKGVKKIHKQSFFWCRKLTIHAAAGSYAEKYARENNIPFVAEG